MNTIEAAAVVTGLLLGYPVYRVVDRIVDRIMRWMFGDDVVDRGYF